MLSALVLVVGGGVRGGGGGGCDWSWLVGGSVCWLFVVVGVRVSSSSTRNHP